MGNFGIPSMPYVLPIYSPKNMALLDGEVWHQPQKVDRKSVLKSLGFGNGEMRSLP